jgi:protein subunit release factor A
LTLHRLGDVLDGSLDELIASLRLAEEQERLGADD